MLAALSCDHGCALLVDMKTYSRWEQIHMARIYLTGGNRQGYDFELKRNPDPLQQWKTTLRAIWYERMDFSWNAPLKFARAWHLKDSPVWDRPCIDADTSLHIQSFECNPQANQKGH